MSRTLVYWFGILGVLFFIIPAILGGFQFEEYSHISQFISESYATGTPYGELFRYCGYIPSGVFLTLFAFSTPKYLSQSKLVTTAFWLFGIFYGLGTVVTSVFPCDDGCNRELIDPSISQLIHNLSGGLTYLIVPFVVIAIGIKSRSWIDSKSYSITTIACGIIALIFAWLMMANPNGNFIGLYQRLVEGALLFWIVRTAFFVKMTKA